MAFLPHMQFAQAAVFKAAAEHFDVYILVRRANMMSLRYVGDPGCAPKRFDCKAKTADADYTAAGLGPKQTAGLVVDPTITGRAAFDTGEKYAKALAEWTGFVAKMLKPEIRTLAGQKAVTYIPGGGLYFVDLDPASPRYGCVKFTSTSLLTAGKYIHGDFDLYGIVRADDPARNVTAREIRPEDEHYRSPEFFDVQNFVNSRLGVPMVLHGAEESRGQKQHTEEGIDIFHPDGTITGAENAVEIARLYATTFKGRKLFTPEGARALPLDIFTPSA